MLEHADTIVATYRFPESYALRESIPDKVLGRVLETWPEQVPSETKDMEPILIHNQLFRRVDVVKSMTEG
jgi:hypothetical protein